jgi:hypothetical protein
MGDGEILPKGAAGAGVGRYATMKEVPRKSALVGEGVASRRSRPAERRWSGSQSTLMMVAVTPWPVQ